MITEDQEREVGEVIAQALYLKKDRIYPDRYKTDWGTKTALGLFRTLRHIIEAETKGKNETV